MTSEFKKNPIVISFYGFTKQALPKMESKSIGAMSKELVNKFLEPIHTKTKRRMVKGLVAAAVFGGGTVLADKLGAPQGIELILACSLGSSVGYSLSAAYIKYMAHKFKDYLENVVAPRSIREYLLAPNK